MCEPCMVMIMSCDTYVGDLEVLPWLRFDLASLREMVGSRYMCPSQFASNGGSVLVICGCGLHWSWLRVWHSTPFGDV